MSGPLVAVVVASTADVPIRPRWLERLVEEAGDRAEVWLVGAIPGRAVSPFRGLARPSTRLVPELWRDGLDASTSPLVAFTTTSMLPEPGWLDALIGALDGGASAAGGPIVADAGLSTIDMAIYLHRFGRYAAATDAIDPPGDNALYRRDALAPHARLWADGFWETRIHAAIRAAGGRFATARGAGVAYLGGGRFGPFLRRRLAHARIFGGEAGGWPMLSAMAVAPAVAARLTLRAARSAGGFRASRIRSLPALGLIGSTWALGEALGRSRQSA